MQAAVFYIATILAFSAAAQGHNPYAGQHDREIKALSNDEARQYLAGAGMGYARAAELNGFPGPMHALELADKLHLSPEQRTSIQRLMDQHKAQARAIGARRVAAEKSLDELFKSGTVGQDRLAEAVKTAAQIDGEYRLSHLDTHRQMKTLLNDHQVAMYNNLRGYSGTKHNH
jgi:Spy/CpxP family protein refolding chaperone